MVPVRRLLSTCASVRKGICSRNVKSPMNLLTPKSMRCSPQPRVSCLLRTARASTQREPAGAP